MKIKVNIPSEYDEEFCSGTKHSNIKILHSEPIYGNWLMYELSYSSVAQLKVLKTHLFFDEIHIVDLDNINQLKTR